jgi:hypothetical protein
MSTDRQDNGGRPAWRLGDRPTLKRLIFVLTVASIAFLATDLVVPRHGKLVIENVFGVYAALALIGVGLMWAGGKLVQALLDRPEDYYDR